jgi:hypothetical protein
MRLAASITSGTLPPRALRKVAILLMLTLSFVIAINCVQRKRKQNKLPPSPQGLPSIYTCHVNKLPNFEEV